MKLVDSIISTIIYLISLNTVAQKASSHSPAFSPDRTKIAFVSNKSGNAEIFVIDLAANKTEQLTVHDSVDGNPSWLSNSELLFDSNRDGAFRGNRGVDEGAKMKKGGSSGMEILYGGWRRKNGEYSALKVNSAFWTSTESDMAHVWHRDVDIADEFIWRSRVVNRML